jgi:ABC-2 type transport system ATP-binding protein
VRLRIDGGAKLLEGIDGVEAVHDFGQAQELRLRHEADPQQVLAAILTRTRVWSFEVAKPSLHDIFVRIAAPQGKEASHA